MENQVLQTAHMLLDEAVATPSQALDNWETIYSAYRTILQEVSSPPASALAKLPYLGLGLQMAKKIGRPETIPFYVSGVKKEIIQGLKMLIK